MMFTASEFRQYAEECLASARAARTDERRKHFIDMAKMWTTAAVRIDGGDSVSGIAKLVADEDG